MSEIDTKLKKIFMRYFRKLYPEYKNILQETNSITGEGGFAYALKTNNALFGNIVFDFNNDELTIFHDITHHHFQTYTQNSGLDIDTKILNVIENGIGWFNDIINDRIIFKIIMEKGKIQIVDSFRTEENKLKELLQKIRKELKKKKKKKDLEIIYCRWSGEIK